jgi:hypothetical protein
MPSYSIFVALLAHINCLSHVPTPNPRVTVAHKATTGNMASHHRAQHYLSLDIFDDYHLTNVNQCSENEHHLSLKRLEFE